LNDVCRWNWWEETGGKEPKRKIQRALEVKRGSWNLKVDLKVKARQSWWENVEGGYWRGRENWSGHEGRCYREKAGCQARISLREVARAKELVGNRRRSLGCARRAKRLLVEGKKEARVGIRRKGGKTGTVRRESKGST
jgi:hypothetical protein